VGDALDEFAADPAILSAHFDVIERVRLVGAGNVDLFAHDAPRRFDRLVQVVIIELSLSQ
jgi:hypothetical protein